MQDGSGTTFTEETIVAANIAVYAIYEKIKETVPASNSDNNSIPSTDTEKQKESKVGLIYRISYSL